MASEFTEAEQHNHLHRDQARQYLGQLEQRLANEEFDLAAVGRMLIANADWPRKIAAGDFFGLAPYAKAMLQNYPVN